MERKAIRLIKKAFYSYPKVMEQAVTSTVEWAESNMAVDFRKVAVQTSPSNSKENQLCNVLDDNLKKVRWCYVVEKVLDHYHFEQDKINFIRTRFFDSKGDIETCLKVGICRATLFNWQNEIINCAFKWAQELSLI